MFLDHMELPYFLIRDQDSNGVVRIADGIYSYCRLVDFYRVYRDLGDVDRTKGRHVTTYVYYVAEDVCKFIDENREAMETAERDFAIVSMYESDFYAAISAAQAVPGKLSFDQKERMKEKS